MKYVRAAIQHKTAEHEHQLRDDPQRFVLAGHVPSVSGAACGLACLLPAPAPAERATGGHHALRLFPLKTVLSPLGCLVLEALEEPTAL
jgi:hypothetical protein